MALSLLDYALLGVIFLSALLGLFRGFAREAFSLAGWVLSFWAATQFTEAVATRLRAYIGLDELRYALAFLAVFVIVLVLTALLGRLLVNLVRSSVLSGVDRSLGILFGLLRGLVLALALVVLGGMTPLADEPLWKDSLSVVYLQQFAGWIIDHMELDVPVTALS